MKATHSHSETISEAFSKMMEATFHCATSKNVVNVTKAYYVYTDLKSGISLLEIEKYRLEKFHSFLWAYVVLHPEDLLTTELWTVIDNRIAQL